MRFNAVFGVAILCLLLTAGAGAWADNAYSEGPGESRIPVEEPHRGPWWGNRGVSWENYIRFEAPDQPCLGYAENGDPMPCETGRCACCNADHSICRCQCNCPWCREHCNLAFGMFFFDLDKADLRPEGRTEGDNVVAYLTQYPERKAVIQGHCCDWASSAYNMQLGRRRAEAVRDYLVQKGLDSGRLEVVSYGEERPIVPNSEERERNRRAVVVTYIDNPPHR